MAYTKYSLTPANNTATPPDGAPEGMLPSAVNDTMRDMMAQIRDCGDGIRDGTYTMTAPKITGGTITGSTINNSAIGGTTAAAGAFTTLSATGATTFSGATVVSGSLTANTFSSSGATITGGTINSTAIGGTTAAAGKFTTLEATGVTTVQAGTVSLPAITTTGDTNTGIYFPAADTIAFTEGGVESMRIDSSGNVGIGTASPQSSLQVSGAVPSAPTGTGVHLGIQSSYALIQLNGGAGAGSVIDFSQSGSDYLGRILYDNTSNYMFFATNTAERMRIDSSGNVGIGTSSPTQKLDVVASNSQIHFGTATTGGGYLMSTVNGQFRISGGAVFDGSNWIAKDTTAGIMGVDGDANIKFFTNTSLTSGNSFTPTERMRIDSSGNVGIGLTSSGNKFEVSGSGLFTGAVTTNTTGTHISYQSSNSQIGAWGPDASTNGTLIFYSARSNGSNGLERMRIDNTGRLLVGCTAEPNNTVNGFKTASDYTIMSSFQQTVLYVNRNGNDGELVQFRQDNSAEGNISVSGSTVSYNGGHLSRWSQLPSQQKDDTLLKGTVMSNLDDMCVWIKDGQELLNEQLNKMKVSDVEGDTNVAGVFVSWQFDEQCQSDDMNVAMTGDMIIRIAEGVVVQRGDLLMSAGDGTAKAQGDDIVRSKTIAKVTSNHITCTYADGSYCVPCVLMAC